MRSTSSVARESNTEIQVVVVTQVLAQVWRFEIEEARCQRGGHRKRGSGNWLLLWFLGRFNCKKENCGNCKIKYKPKRTLQLLRGLISPAAVFAQAAADMNWPIWIERRIITGPKLLVPLRHTLARDMPNNYYKVKIAKCIHASMKNKQSIHEF